MTETMTFRCYRCWEPNFSNDDKSCDACVIKCNKIRSEYYDDLNAKARAYRIKNKEAFSIREKQYYIDNKEVIKARAARYRATNKEAIALKDKQKYIECVPCGIDIRICSKARHCKSKTHQNNLIQTETIDKDIK